ncbi:MAG: carboxypeptidase-like regulatory domain-containing protein [Prolixibacteraceae bacterium]|jgi:hypothetical protein|nr:carboxypeptidase-like regulatory domain-containing protein [Prolixibacteraceae bacterium]
MNKNLFIIALFFVCTVHAQKSSSILKGRVYNAKNNEPVEFATIVIQNSVNGTNSDLDGNFLLKDIQPGFYQLKVSAIGFKTYITETFRITLAAGATINVPCQPGQCLEFYTRIYPKNCQYRKTKIQGYRGSIRPCLLI